MIHTRFILTPNTTALQLPLFRSPPGSHGAAALPHVATPPSHARVAVVGNPINPINPALPTPVRPSTPPPLRLNCSLGFPPPISPFPGPGNYRNHGKLPPFAVAALPLPDQAPPHPSIRWQRWHPLRPFSAPPWGSQPS